MKIVNAVYRINTIDMRDVNENIEEVVSKIGKYITEIRKTNADSKAPLNIPRLICNDKDKLFNIVITDQSVEIQAINAENINDEVLLDKMVEVVDNIGSFFEDYSDSPFNFCGFSVQTKVTTEEIKENPTDYVSDRIQGFGSNLLVDNAMVRKCFIQGDYYINLTMRNDKQMRVSAPKQGAKPTKIEVTDEFMIFEIDVNDKYSFLNKPEYECEIEQAIGIAQDVSEFYRNKALSFVQTGEFDYFK